jgi:hypothetical protein
MVLSADWFCPPSGLAAGHGTIGAHEGTFQPDNCRNREEALRRRARQIQALARTLGPLAGVVATACGAIYTGSKSIIPS